MSNTSERVRVKVSSTVVTVWVKEEVTEKWIPTTLTQDEALQLIVELNEAVTEARS